jgi:hypothetical protein
VWLDSVVMHIQRGNKCKTLAGCNNASTNVISFAFMLMHKSLEDASASDTSGALLIYGMRTEFIFVDFHGTSDVGR